MSLIKRCSCLILLVLTACENKLNSAEPTTVKAQEKKVEEKSSEYTQVALLSLLQTNDELSDHKNNVVTLKGTGTNSSYKIIYKFNTAGNTSFKVIEQTLKSSSTGCSAPDLEMWLKGQNSSRQISIIDQVNVDPNTDYTLEVIAINHSCKALELSLNIVA